MIEIVGDYWKELEKGYDAAVCTTNTVVRANGALVMGAGIAKAFRDRFPNLDKIWGRQCKIEPEKILNTHISMFSLQPTNCVEWLIGIPTKHHWQNPSPIDLIIRSCKKLDDLAIIANWQKILMTRPGCGNGGLKWEDVKKQIAFLDDRFVVINKE